MTVIRENDNSKIKNKFIKILTKRNLVWMSIYSVVAAVMVFLSFATDRLYSSGNIEWTAGYIGITALKSLALGIVVGVVILAAEEFIHWILAKNKRKIEEKFEEKTEENTERETATGKKCKSRSVLVWLISFVAIVLARVPAFLAYYPGICAYDTEPQMTQVVGNAYNEHHPILHTLLLRMFVDLGKNAFGSENTGLALYTVAQVLIMSAGMAYVVAALYRVLGRSDINRKITLILTGVLTACMMFFPYNQYMALSMTKDSIFSVAFMVMVLGIAEAVLEKRNSLKYDVRDVVIFIAVFLTSVMRNNAKYALAVMLLIVVIVGLVKKSRVMWRILSVCMAGFVIGMAAMSIASKATNATQGDKREMLSVPIQQISRTVILHTGVANDGSISDEDMAIVNEFLLNESYQYYNPWISDPVKRHTNTSVVVRRKMDFAKMYLRLLKNHPGDYVNAFLALNSGFISVTDTSHAYINQVVSREGLGYVQTRWSKDFLKSCGLYEDSRWASLHEYMEQWATDNAYLDIPVFRFIFMPGLYLWAMIFSVLHFIRKKRYALLIPMSFVMVYYATMLFGPTVQMRYVYPIMLVCPFVIVICMMNICRKSK